MGFRKVTRSWARKWIMFSLAAAPIRRIEDLRLVASIVKGKKKADDVEVWIVPGSKQVETATKEEGI